jgi:hypothetical protein
MTHLTLTGFEAGRTLCGSTRETGGSYAHAVYAPLHKAEYRAGCCQQCLREWVASFEDDNDTPPTWAGEVAHLRAQGELEN